MLNARLDALTEPPCTGIDLIDSEDAYLIKLLGELEKVCVRGTLRCDACAVTQIAQCDSALTVLFSKFLGFMFKHFRDEENFMRMIGMPENLRDRHAEEHANISQRIRELIDQSLNTVVVNPADFHLTIVSWLEDHIKNWDMPIASHLGLPPKADGGS